MDDPEKRQRRERGSRQVFKDGKDAATGEPRFYARFTVRGERQFVRLKATSMDDARVEFAEGKKRVERGEPFHFVAAPAVVGPTVRQLAEQFKREAQPIDVDPAYVDEYRRIFWSDYACNVDKYLGEKIAAEVKRSDVVKMISASISDGRSPRSILRGRSALSVLYSWALNNDLVDGNNPTTGVECPQYIPKKEFYTTGEVAAMLRAADGTLLGRLIAFHYFCGARPGEMAGLQWGDIDFAAQTVTIRRSRNKPYTKTKAIKVLALHPVVRDMLGPLAGDDDALVFTRNGQMLPKCDHKGACWGLRDLTEVQLGFAPKRHPWYSFRRTHATVLDEQLNASSDDLMRALGHRTRQQSLEYSQADGRNTRALVAKLPDPRALVPTPAVGRN
jgi:integrase